MNAEHKCFVCSDLRRSTITRHYVRVCHLLFDYNTQELVRNENIEKHNEVQQMSP